MRTLLIFEPDSEGHPREWLEHLLEFAPAQDAVDMLWIVVAPALAKPLAAAVQPARLGSVRILALRPLEQRLCCHRMLVVSGFARWFVMRRYLARTGADAGHFLSIDHLSLPLALGFRMGGRPISGILFRPSVHYRALPPYRPGLGEWARDMRKAILYRLMLLNGAVRTVLSLDPYFADYAAARYVGGAKVLALPDPAFPPPPTGDSDAGLARCFPGDRRRLLLFGAITERKGVLVLLDALALLPRSVAGRLAIMLAGRIEPSIRGGIEQRRRHLAAVQPTLWLHVEDRRLASAELTALVRRSEVVLAPYQRFVGSSGVVLWAARAGKPLLTQDFGLIGRMVRENRLGLTTDVGDPRSLAEAIAAAVERDPNRLFDVDAARAFVSERTPDRFAAGVYASLGID